MKATGKIILFLLPLLLIVSCKSDTNAIVTGQKRNPIPVDQVKIFDGIPYGAQPIGFLMAKAGGKKQGSIDKAIQNLREKAASFGGNGIVITHVGTSTVFINNWPIDETQVSGKAFYYERQVAESSPGPSVNPEFQKLQADVQGADADAERKIFEEKKNKAEGGDPVAQYNLSACYINGIGVTKDMPKGIEWLRKSAEQDYAEAEFILGTAYTFGRGVVKDSVQSAKWYQKAAEQNHPGAQYNLGVAYFNGDGTLKDYVQAYKWVDLASAHGDQDAKLFLPKIEQKMTAAQIAEAQSSAREFKPR